jgi:hypothetical protein
VQVWDGATGALASALPASPGPVAFSPDGRRLVTAGGGCRLWEVGTWRLVARVGGDWPAFEPEGRRLAVEMGYGTLALVDAEDGRELARLEAPDRSSLRPACFSPDGTQLLACASEGQAVYVWDLSALAAGLKAESVEWGLPTRGPSAPAAPLPFRLDPGAPVGGPPPPDSSPRQEVEHYTRSLLVRPDADAYGLRARAYFRLGVYGKAAADVTAALRLKPDNWSDHGLRGLCFIQLREYELGVADLERSLQLHPDQAYPAHFLASLYAAGPLKVRDPAKALPLARRAARLDPKRGAYRLTLGQALYRLGQHREAAAELEAGRGLGLRGTDEGAALYFLAMCRRRLGDRDGARECYDRAVRWQEQARLSPEDLTRAQTYRAEAALLLGLAPAEKP